MRPQSVRVLAGRAYPGLRPSGYCSCIHANEGEQVACTICFPNLRTLIDAHNDLKQKAWAAIADVQVEMTRGDRADWEYMAKRLREGYGGDPVATTSAPESSPPAAPAARDDASTQHGRRSDG